MGKLSRYGYSFKKAGAAYEGSMYTSRAQELGDMYVST